MADSPEKKVSDQTGRKAIEHTLSRLAKAQVQAGQLPDVRKLERFVRPIAEETFKKHEEKQARPAAWDKRGAGAAPGESKARIDRGLVGSGTTAINRPVDWKVKRARTAVPKTREAKLVKKRLDLLQQFPEWVNRLMKAAHEGELAARRSGSPADREDWTRRRSIIGDHMLKVIEQSNGVFGDFRDPKTKAPPLIFGPK